MENILGILFLATFTEGLIEYLFAKDGVSQPILKYVGLAIGVCLAVAYQIDLLAMVGLHTALPLVSYIVSGIVIGRGSNYVNDVVSMLRGNK